MKKVLLGLALFLCLTGFAFSQNLLISVQKGDSAKFYTNFQNAIDSAEIGSTIVLPAQLGDYQIYGNFTINKKLYIYGVGHYPDSTSATGRTIINGNITLLSGADSGCISGLYINGDIKFGTSSSNQIIKGYTIKRNRISAIYMGFSNPNPLCEGNYIDENIIVYLFGYKSSQNIISKNFIHWALQDFENSYFKNNIYLRYAFHANTGGCWGSSIGTYAQTSLENINNSVFTNNIFMNVHTATYGGCFGETRYAGFSGGYFLYNCNYNTFNNNLFESDIFLPSGTNSGENNIYNQSHDSTFVTHNGHNGFDYSHNYHLKDTSPGKFAGTDSTDIGLYDQNNPYKESAVPIIPHITSKKVTPTEVTNGRLFINVKAKAQTK